MREDCYDDHFNHDSGGHNRVECQDTLSEIGMIIYLACTREPNMMNFYVNWPFPS
jgi:hypothetical protein